MNTPAIVPSAFSTTQLVSRAANRSTNEFGLVRNVRDVGVLGEAGSQVERLAADHRGAVSRERLNERREAFPSCCRSGDVLDRERLTDRCQRRLDVPVPAGSPLESRRGNDAVNTPPT